MSAHAVPAFPVSVPSFTSHSSLSAVGRSAGAQTAEEKGQKPVSRPQREPDLEPDWAAAIDVATD